MNKQFNPALEFQHFLPQQIKCRVNCMKIHFALALPLQCFCQGWQDFIYQSLGRILFTRILFARAGRILFTRASAFTSATSAKTQTRSKLVKLLPYFTKNKKYYVYNYSCANIVIRNAMLFSHVKHFVLKIILDALFEFKSKDKYERKMLSRLKRNFKRKIYINSFCLISQVLFFFGTSR